MVAASATKPNPWIIASLALLMAATRFHHEGTAFALPDASLAVFFLAGWHSRSHAVLAGLLLGAFAIDYLAIFHAGVSGYCFTPAYVFLIPTYAALWAAGCWSCRVSAEASFPWRKIVLALPLATTVAFVISNGSFLLFSGRLAGADWMAYSLGVARDYPGYLGAALMYTILALSLLELARMLPTLEQGVESRAKPGR